MKIAVLGLGNVGLNLLRIMKDYAGHHRKLIGEPLELVVAGDSTVTIHSDDAMDPSMIIESKRNGDIGNSGYEQTGRKNIFDQDIDIAVDVSTATRSGDIGRDLYLDCFMNGIDVVTAKKSPLANHWKEVMNAANNTGRTIRYESTVAGGVPLFSFLESCLNASPVLKMTGVVNSTANFVLSRMSEGKTEETAVEEARSLGIVEADASIDLDGLDNAWKALIIANTIGREPVDISDLRFEGISEYIEKRAEVIPGARLISEVTVVEDRTRIFAAVRELESSDPLSVLDRDSAGYVVKTGTGEASVIGYHDGPLETAAGVMNDIILLSRKRKVLC